MTNELISAVTQIVVGITGVAILAVILSKNSNTTAVIQAGSQGYSGMLSTALSPITGTSTASGFNTGQLYA